jgi:DNA integrity scanning protein DisA with diadenylate cyclase activity
MTADTEAVGVTVSEEDRKIRIFKGGKILRTIEPHA